MNLFALRRLRDLGAHTAQVWCRGDDDYPVPRQLYESVGFSDVVARTVGVAKPAEPS